MAAGRPGHKYALSAGGAINKQAQLGNAYQELGRELCTDAVKVVGGYTLGRVIGEGTFGSVHLATHRLTGTRCAIKKIPKSATPHLTRELHHHRRLHHPNIVHLHEIVATETHIWLVSELCSGGELFDYLVERGRLLEGEARRLFGELTVAVGWLHRQGVVHRDLKLENILLDGEMRIKVGDLGFAREWQKNKLMETFCGTTGYASPEMLQCRKYLGVETDVWSLGIILYVLLCGGLPFDDDDERAMKDLICKGEYEEPEWLSEEAKTLIRSMLQQEPIQRPTIEAILSDPWFKMTIIDQPPANGETNSMPSTPNLGAVPETDDESQPHFEDTFGVPGPGPSTLKHLNYASASPSPLTTQTSFFAPDKESEPSETSLDLADSEHSKVDSGITTPTTTEDEDQPKPILRNHSGEFSQTERALELLHPNASQSTIRRPGDETPSLSSYRSKFALNTPMEGQSEVDEEGMERDESSASLPNIDDHSLQLPLSQHSRTPSRTKRRSVSSTLSLERRLSHHSSTGQMHSHAPEDYLATLNHEQPALFTRPAEKHLLNSLATLGFDTGQLVHSVNSDACDASAATWWILRQKQTDRGETDEAVDAMNSSAARRRERAAAYNREERRKAREKSSRDASREVSREASPDIRTPEVKFLDHPIPIRPPPRVDIMDLGAPIISPPNLPKIVASPEIIDANYYDLAPSQTAGNLLHPDVAALKTENDISEKKLPQTPPKESGHRADLLASPTDSSPKERERLKTRSPSMSMLQRATSALIGGGKKHDEKDKDKEKEKDQPQHVEHDGKAEGRTSPTKLTKPKPKMTKSESENTLLTVPRGSPASSMTVTSPSGTPQQLPATSTSRDRSPVGSAPAAEPTNATPDTSEGVARAKSTKRDSLWTTFRHMFAEDRRRRKREPGSPLTLVNNQIKIAPAVVLSRGPAARSPHVNRMPQSATTSRRASLDVRPGMHSRRSSSVNSRRSSVTEMHIPSEVHDHLASLGRRTSHRSAGSQTPTSDREYGSILDNPSRPGSAHSLQRGSSRRSSHSLNMRSPSMQSRSSGRFRTPASPLHDYQRMPPGGMHSTRIRHIKVIPEAQILRSSSKASSTRSHNSSRASSIDQDRSRLDDMTGESDYDTGTEDISIRSRRRRSGDKRHAPFAHSIHSIHRTRSPLAPTPHKTGTGSSKKGPIRDVFQQKDDEWEDDEDEQPSFAGGLGQSDGVNWDSTTTSRAAAFPSTYGGKKRHSARTRKGPEEKDANAAQGVQSGQSGQSGQRDSVIGGRRGMPERSGKPPIVMEEVEEEEEE